MATVFTKIIDREIPAHIVAEDERYIAFLDIMPMALGHTLVVPKQEVDNIFDIEDEKFQDLLLFAKQVAKALQHAIPCVRVGMAVVGLEVPHAHIHLVPINKLEDINFSQKRSQASLETLVDVA
ncbi:MAG: HIT family protein, partial [Bacteroidota bacterium]